MSCKISLVLIYAHAHFYCMYSHKSSRERQPPSKMADYQKEETVKKEKKFFKCNGLYQQNQQIAPVSQQLSTLRTPSPMPTFSLHAWLQQMMFSLGTFLGQMIHIDITPTNNTRHTRINKLL